MALAKWLPAHLLIFLVLWSTFSFVLRYFATTEKPSQTELAMPIVVAAVITVSLLWAWTMLIHRHGKNRKWLLLGGSLFVIAIIFYIILENTEPSGSQRTALYFVDAGLFSISAGVVIASTVCGIPLRYSFNRVLLAVSFACFLSPFIFAFPSNDNYLAFFIVGGLALLLLLISRCALDDVAVDSREVSPFSPTPITIRKENPWSPILSFFVAAYMASALVSVSWSYYIDVLPKHFLPSNKSFINGSLVNRTDLPCFVELGDRSLYISYVLCAVALPTLFIPLVIHYFGHWICTSRLMQLISSGISTGCFFIAMRTLPWVFGSDFRCCSVNTLLFISISGFAIWRAALIGFAYNDLLIKSLVATRNFETPVTATATIAIASGCLGLVSGLLAPQLILSSISSVEIFNRCLVGAAGLAVGLSLLVNIWEICCKSRNTGGE